MERIIDEFSASPLYDKSIRIDPEKTAGKYHLRSIIHNEIFQNNNHSRVE